MVSDLSPKKRNKNLYTEKNNKKKKNTENYGRASNVLYDLGWLSQIEFDRVGILVFELQIVEE